MPKADTKILKEENITESQPTIKIAFGSCNDEDRAQPLWSEIAKEKADLWLWLGDNIYGDSEDMSVLQSKYNKQNANPAYADFKKSILMNGTWDDHDYGVNDGGKEYGKKMESQQLLLDFLGVNQQDDRRTRAGVYGSQVIRVDDIEVKILLLDTRFFRDELLGKKGKYDPNLDGTILGTEQWEWLKSEMKASRSDVHLIASSIQLLSKDHGYEKWSNFPNERTRLLDLIHYFNLKNTIVLSGDRHTSEISMIKHKGNLIYDITSSGLTHTVSTPREEYNEFRVKDTPLIFDLNYGVIEITKGDKLEIIGKVKLLSAIPQFHINSFRIDKIFIWS